MKNKQVEKEILKILESGKKSTSEISALINRNYYYTLGALIELSDKIKKEEKGSYTFWSLK